MKPEQQKTKRAEKTADTAPKQEKRRSDRTGMQNRPPVDIGDVQLASSRECSEVFEHPDVLTIFDEHLSEPGRALVPREIEKPSEPQGLDRIMHGLHGIKPGKSPVSLRAASGLSKH